MATEYLDLDDAFDAYAEAVEVSVRQAKDALLNPGQLESALARPQNAAAYEDAYDMTLSEEEIFALAVGVADAQISVDAAEARLRPTVVPL